MTSLYLVPTISGRCSRPAGWPRRRRVRTLAYAGASMTPRSPSSCAEPCARSRSSTTSAAPRSTPSRSAPTAPPSRAARPGRGSSPASAWSRPDPGAPPTTLVAPGEQGQVIVSMRARRRSPATGSGRTPTRSRSATAGTSPATSPPPTRTATSGSSGRVDDMINSGGENIYPDEIEAALARCPDIDDVCVVGCPTSVGQRSPRSSCRPASDPTRPLERWRPTPAGSAFRR